MIPPIVGGSEGGMGEMESTSTVIGAGSSVMEAVSRLKWMSHECWCRKSVPRMTFQLMLGVTRNVWSTTDSPTEIIAEM